MGKAIKDIDKEFFDKSLSLLDTNEEKLKYNTSNSKSSVMLSDEDYEQVVGFNLSDETFGIDVLSIEEIIKPTRTTYIPNTKEFVIGVINLRGKIIPIIDLRLKFLFDEKLLDFDSRIIIVRSHDYNVGFLVDKIERVYYVNKSMIDPTPPNVPENIQEFLRGVGKLEKGEVITLLDVKKILKSGGV